MENIEKYLNGYDIINWFQLGFIEVNALKKRLNSINVFPVADGDTGTNLATTLKAIAERSNETESFGRMFWDISEIGLAHARGNSGIIFVSYVNGIANESKLFEKVNLKEFAVIAKAAVSYVYQAVENPVEGTMISVIRDWANFLFENHHRFESFQELFHHAFEAAEKSLEGTTEKIEVLRRNNVVDSGALGFIGFLEGANEFFKNRGELQAVKSKNRSPLRMKVKNEASGLSEIIHEDVKYRYCTEFIIGKNMERELVHTRLKPLGDSIIVLNQGNQTKVHLHTNVPEEAIWEFQKIGNLKDQKVDDMVFQSLQAKAEGYPIGIVTDSIADLPSKCILENLVSVIPFSVLIEGSAFLDKKTITNAQLLSYLENIKKKDVMDYPTSSLPEPSRVMGMLENLLGKYESLIIISVSGKLSGAYNSLLDVVGKLQNQFKTKKISVIDSRLNAGAQGLLVQKAIEGVKSGLEHDKLVREIEEFREKIKIYVCLETIDNAVRGGRVSDRIGKVAKAFGARPIMTLNSKGEGGTFGIGFSKQGITKRILKLIEKAKREQGISSYNIVHCDNKILAEEYNRKLTRILGKEPEYVTEISTITSLYSGRGCVAVSFVVEKTDSREPSRGEII